VEDGFKIRFLHNKWCGDHALKEAFLDLYSIARVKDAFVVDHLELSSDFYQWNVSFIRAPHDWKVDAFPLFLNFLYSFRLRQRGEDKL